ncbi:hypothetical protein [Chitinophaga sp. sic0106]|uniref:hypothetical protein n=1 Tax=Chitinophaga sp. sic0106 TaxID=2854785 RepID=UPI001C47CF5C|nr:hypothetical protein [Chitinophaga sp. sic0106]MBV7530848.1 hypothetical protein [Chitinophaga sp. sic0106]
MHLRNILLALFALLLTATAFAGGMSAWEEKTPKGNTIYHDGTAGGWITLTMDTTEVMFRHFYFYKGCTIATDDSLHYIINENNNTVQRFDNEAAWKAAIKAQHLNPLWKREYNDSYGTDKFGHILLLIFFPIPLLLPILWLVCLISLFFPSGKFFAARKHFSWIYPVIVLLVIFYDNIPQSI